MGPAIESMENGKIVMRFRVPQPRAMLSGMSPGGCRWESVGGGGLTEGWGIEPEAYKPVRDHASSNLTPTGSQST